MVKEIQAALLLPTPGHNLMISSFPESSCTASPVEGSQSVGGGERAHLTIRVASNDRQAQERKLSVPPYGLE